jgi:hypothetical protein
VTHGFLGFEFWLTQLDRAKEGRLFHISLCEECTYARQ